MTKKPAVTALILTALTGCGLDGVGGLGDAQLLVPDDVELHWDPAFNGHEDGLGVLVPVDLMVYGSATGEPLEAVGISIESGHAGVWILPPHAVGFADPEDCVDCAYTWDAYRDQYFELLPFDALDEPLRLETDIDGLARAYVFVDAFPRDERQFGSRGAESRGRRGFGPAEVSVVMDLQGDTYEHSFALEPR